VLLVDDLWRAETWAFSNDFNSLNKNKDTEWGASKKEKTKS
jgi:hypothetical protein